MRIVIVTVLILVIFLVGAVMLNRYIDTSCESLLEDVKQLHTFVEGNSWDDAKDQLTDLKAEWEKVKKRWQLFLEHYEMDTIDITISKLSQYVDIEERVMSLGEVAEFELLIDHIKDKKHLKLENIL